MQNICSMTFLQDKELMDMESIFCINIPVQMISCTDTDEKINPIRFRFQNKTRKLTTIQISCILKSEQKTNHFTPFSLVKLKSST